LGILRQDRRLLSLKSLLGAIACYCALFSLMIIALLGNINLSNWDDGLYLTIGNGTTGSLPWNGQISSLYISDRGLDREIKAIFQQPNTFFSQSPSFVTSFDFVDRIQIFGYLPVGWSLVSLRVNFPPLVSP